MHQTDVGREQDDCLGYDLLPVAALFGAVRCSGVVGVDEKYVMVPKNESQHIPTTNNATEEVIRIFTQHYKTFCGLYNVETARFYLAAFEKVYRFSPFSDDAQERIRDKCPLELAGYEVHKLPMARLFRGLALQWPSSAFQELVPNG